MTRPFRLTAPEPLDEREIERFRDNIPCPLPREDCRWIEKDDGSAWCRHCGSGYLATNRERLRHMYEDRT